MKTYSYIVLIMISIILMSCNLSTANDSEETVSIKPSVSKDIVYINEKVFYTGHSHYNGVITLYHYIAVDWGQLLNEGALRNFCHVYAYTSSVRPENMTKVNYYYGTFEVSYLRIKLIDESGTDIDIILEDGDFENTATYPRLASVFSDYFLPGQPGDILFLEVDFHQYGILESETIVDNLPEPESEPKKSSSYFMQNDNGITSLSEAKAIAPWTVDDFWTNRKPTVIDVNGDGNDDLLMVQKNSNYESYIFINNGNGFSAIPIPAYVGWGSNATWANRSQTVLDANGDGLDDLLMIHQDGTYESKILINTGNGFTNYNAIAYTGWGTDGAWANRYPTVLDVNGDGCDDLLLIHPDDNYKSKFLISTGSGYLSYDATAYAGWGNNGSWSNRIPTVLDANGDGRDDLLMRYKSDKYATMLLMSTGNGFTVYNMADYTGWGNNGSWSDRTPTALDVNGDGRDDLLMQYKNDTYGTMLFISTGNGFTRYDMVTYTGWGNNGSWANRDATVLDFNGDGNDDLLMRHPDDAYSTQLFVSTGTGFSRTDITLVPGWQIEGAWADRKPFVMDMNGDGCDGIFLQYKD